MRRVAILNRRSTAGPAVVGALCAVLLVGMGCGDTPRAAAIGAVAPDYAAQQLDGTPVTLESQRGKVVLLNIWATWCKPCRQEIPALETLHQRHREAGLEIIGVSIDQPGMAGRIQSFAQELGASYTLWHDPDDRISTMFLAIGVPASYVIDRDGVLRWRHVGPVTADDSSLNAVLRTALAAEPSAD